jgi:GntR family transcriptional regulator
MAAPRSFQRGGAPAYRQIAQMLHNRVVAGAYSASRLPTDFELMEEFRVSRHTVRAAVAKLVDDGLVERLPGRGTFIAQGGPDNLGWRIRSLDDILDQQFSEPPTIIDAQFRPASHDLDAAEALQIDIAEQMFCILALRTERGLPLSCSEIFIPEDIGRVLADDVAEHVRATPMIRAIERECHISATRAVQSATALPASREIAYLLDVRPGTCLLMLARTYFTMEGRPVDHARMFGRPDRYRHTIEFTRQKTGR